MFVLGDRIGRVWAVVPATGVLDAPLHAVSATTTIPAMSIKFLDLPWFIAQS
jgi:hypothetical protein